MAMAHTTLVNVDIDTASKLVAHLSHQPAAASSDFQSHCETLIQQAKTFELLSYVINRTDSLLLAQGNLSDVQGCFDAIVSILYTLTDPNETLQIVALTVEKLTANTNEQIALRLRLIVNFYNLLITLENKLCVLKAIFSYAVTTHQEKLVEHFQPSVLRWITQWNLPLPDQRELFLLLSTLSSEATSPSLDYLLKYFDTFALADETFPAAAVAIATATVVRALQSTAVSDSARRALHRSLSARQPIIKDPSLLSLLEVLRLIVTGDLTGFLTFHSIASNASLLSAHGVASDHLVHSLKLLKLCHLASTPSSSSCPNGIVLPYDAIASALQVTEEEVEVWVVEAISLQLLEASMDQFNRVVVVTRSLRFSFDREQWLSLKGKVDQWKDSISALSGLLSQRSQQQLA